MSHRRRQLFDSDKATFLTAIGACRDACIVVLRRVPPTDEIARRTRALSEAIDDVVEVLTGSRQHFWLKPHGGPKLQKSDEP